MEIQIGRNIRAMRKECGITQEELADALNVTFQTVSKWERGESYPDITILPKLSDYFDTSIDALMGVDRATGHALNRDIYGEVHELEADGRWEEAVEVLRNTLTEFPSEYGVMCELALALSVIGGTAEREEAIGLCEFVCENAAGEKVKNTARACLCILYARNGDAEKAAAATRTRAHIWESREMLMPEIFAADGEKYASELRRSIRVALSVIGEKINRADGDNIFKTLTLGAEECVDVSEIIRKIAEFML